MKSELQTELQNFKFTFDNLRVILDELRNLHPEISDDFCNGKGIGLLNLDGQIAEYIIKNLHIQTSQFYAFTIVLSFLLNKMTF